MSSDVGINLVTMSDTRSKLQAIIADLESAYEESVALSTTEFYAKGVAQGRVGMYAITCQHLSDLIAHYQRLSEYTAFVERTFLEADGQLAGAIQRLGS